MTSHFSLGSLRRYPQRRAAERALRSLYDWAVRHREGLWIVAVLTATALAHAVNMFEFPYYENDEGTYVAQGWAVLTGRLAPYTYWYDHAPVGWFQITAWDLLTGGFHTFGNSVESGRMLMLLFHIGSTFFLYRIARTLSGSAVAAALACLLFGLSAYGMYFHRRVLLDNITTFWMLLSVLLLLGRPLKLRGVWLSGLALGIAILSKEVTVFVVPVMAALVWMRTSGSSRWFAIIGWIALVGSLFSLWVLMATLQGELFPTGTLLGGTADHVSLLETLKFQASRGKDGGLLDLSSGFWHRAAAWFRDEPFLVLVGTVCALLSVLRIRQRPLAGMMGLLTLSLWGFLARGGEVIAFYLVPLLPLLALNVVLEGTTLARAASAWLRRRDGLGTALGYAVPALMAGVCALGPVGGYVLGGGTVIGTGTNPLVVWQSQPGVGQREAIAWVEANTPPDSRIIIDMYMWLDLHDTHDLAHYYWKVDQDPAIRNGVLGNDWHNVDYVVMTDQMSYDAEVATNSLVKEALANSTGVALFNTGWRVEVRKVDHAADRTAQSAGIAAGL